MGVVLNYCEDEKEKAIVVDNHDWFSVQCIGVDGRRLLALEYNIE